MPTQSLEIRRSSAALRGEATLARSVPAVSKYIDTTICIGCKACEVACAEWNDMPFQQTSFDNTYQTMPDTAWNYWNLIKFTEYQPENAHQPDTGNFMWLMR